MKSNPDIIPHQYRITRADRAALNRHKALAVWFTGLSGAGKSTLANALEVELVKMGIHTYILDGDNIRSGLNADLDFSESGRTENIRRIGEVTNLFVDAGIVVLSAFISPFRKDRESVRQIVGAENFVEVFVDCPLEICEQRDVKGLYKKARAGEIKNFTGIDSPFEAPINPDVYVNTHEQSLQECLDLLINYFKLRMEN
jgi:adenylylsulfate kinase